LPLALEALRRSAEATFTPRGQKPSLNVALDELALTRERLKALGDRPALYFEAVAKLRALEEGLAANDEELSIASSLKASLARLHQALPDLERLAAAQAELASLPELSGFPEAGTSRLLDLEGRLEGARADRDEQAAKARAVDEQLRFLSGGPREGPPEETLRAAVDAFTARLALHQGLPARRAGLEEKKKQVDRALGCLGLSLDAPGLLGLDLGAAAKGALTALREKSAAAELLLAQREEAWKAARQVRERAEAEVARVTAQVARLPATPGALVRKRQAALGRLLPYRDEAARLLTRRGELRAAAESAREVAEAPPRETFPLWALFLSLLLLGGAAAGVMMAAPSAGLAAGGGAAGLAGLLVLVQRRAARAFLEQREAARARTASRERELSRLSAEIAAVERRGQETHQAIGLSSAEAGLEEGAPPSRLQELSLELANELEQVELRGRLAQDLEQLTARLSSAVHGEKEAKADRDLAEAGQSKLLREVDAVGASRNFPRGLSAASALELWAEAAALKGRLGDLATEGEALLADEWGCAEAARAVVQGASEAGLSAAASHGAEAAAQALSLLLGRGQEAEAERRRLVERKEALFAALARASRACAEAEEAHAALLAQGGAGDAEAFRSRAGQAARFLEAKRLCRELLARLEAGAALDPSEVRERVKAAGGPAGLSEQLAQAGEKVAGLAARSKALADERGGVRERVQGFEKDTEVSALRVAEEALIARAAELAERYAVDRLALALLGQARRRFEDEQQPRVVKLASGIFGELTGGRYAKVFVAPGGGKDLALRDTTGKEWSAEKLSRGTRELLYLAFRLAVIEDFGETRVPLPVILDDILVNLDPERTRAAIAVLARLSRRHQVIAFTCHPTLEAPFKAQGATLVPIAAERLP
ncbi:MAG: AAA family ATPase, partial [Myxococcaceae bacterium]